MGVWNLSAAYDSKIIPVAVAYDAVSAAYATTGASGSFTHTATAGSYVIVAAGNYYIGRLTSATYGGQAMSYLGTSSNNSYYGHVSFYGLSNAPGGSQTVSFNTDYGYTVLGAISFKNATSAGNASYAYNSGGSTGTHSVSCAEGEMILQGWGYYYEYGTIPTVGGGTNVFKTLGYQAGITYGGLALSYSDKSTAFTSTSYAQTQSSMAVVLSPRIFTKLATTVYSQSGIYSSGNVYANWSNMNDGVASGASGATATNYQSNNWIRADCGSIQYIGKIVIGYDYLGNLYGGWGTSYTDGAIIQGSNDAVSWTNITTAPTYSTTGSSNGLVSIDINQSWRYIQAYKTSYFPLTEFQVWVG